MSIPKQKQVLIYRLY